MALSFAFPFLYVVAQTLAVLFSLVVAFDAMILFNKRIAIKVSRVTAPVLSLGDDNVIELPIENNSTLRLEIEIIEELPEQFQERTFSKKLQLNPKQQTIETYKLRPVSRGEFSFGKTIIFIHNFIGLVRRRISFPTEKVVPVYPSIIQMKRYELKTFERTARELGVRKVRRIGHSYEFEHIKTYVKGDDYRSINWKATGRRNQLMVNQYEDEKSQPVYCIIDKSRVMHMPFEGLSLFDYAVNASLVMSNIILGKYDKAGLITFAEQIKSIVRADRGKLQLKKIMENLYREREGATESNFENLYLTVRKVANGRSLLFLYTNFESTYALQRALPQLRKLNDQHLLVVIFFENTEVSSINQHVDTLEDIYTQITAEQYSFTKIQLAQQLRQLGIFTILTRPENLTVTVINKYLELKSRGLI